MKINIGTLDRWIRFIVGTLLTSWAAAGGPWWTWLGIAAIATAAWRFSPVYTVFRINTTQPSSSQGVNRN